MLPSLVPLAKLVLRATLFPVRLGFQQLIADLHLLLPLPFHVGSVPFEGIKWVRIHFLLDLLHYLDAKDVPGGSSNSNFTIFNDVRERRRTCLSESACPSCKSHLGLFAHLAAPHAQGFLAGKAINWTDMDASLDMVIDSGLFLGFEVMGNPQSSDEKGLFNSLKDASQLTGFGSLVSALAKRYIERYGLANVRQWRFESWNGKFGASG